MTVIAALVLAACGGSGSSKPKTESTPTPPTVPTPPNPNPNKNPTEPKPTVDGDKAKDHQEITTKPYAQGDYSFVGSKNIFKNKSDLRTNSSPDGKAEKIVDNSEAMQVQGLHRSLDTIVVGEELDKDGKPVAGGKVIYLEDFDFRGNTGFAEGKFTLQHIHVGKSTTDAEDRTTAEGEGSETKTNKKGKQSGEALVYHEGRVNYTTDRASGVKTDGTLETDNAALPKYQSRAVKDTVAEVYGARTNASANEYGTQLTQTTDTKNAPFQGGVVVTQDKEKQTVYTAAGELKRVQYGRVTSTLHNVNLGTVDANGNRTGSDLRDGKEIGKTATFIAGYGQQGTEGTEDQYFYRGLDNVSKKELDALKKAQPDAKLTYNGHAVTYGINNSYYSADAISVPNAVGANVGFVSGTHATATVDLKDNTVQGSLYNNWFAGHYKDGEKIRKADVVTFEGTLADNGNIAGTATRLEDKAPGVFGATLFGEKADELGGIISSNDKKDKAWGAVFGATLETKVKTPSGNRIGGSNNQQ